MNITRDMILRDATKGPNFALAGRIVEGVATDAELATAARYIAKGVKAAAHLQAAIDLGVPPVVPARTNTRVTTAPSYMTPGPRGGDPVKRLRRLLAEERSGKSFPHADNRLAYKATEGLDPHEMAVELGLA